MTEASVDLTLGHGHAFRVADVVMRSFSVFWRNFIWIVPVAVLPTVFLAPVFLNQAAFAPRSRIDPDLAVEIMAGVLVYLLLGLWAQTTISHVAVEDLRGHKVRIGASTRRGFARLLPVIALLIVMSLGIALGFALLIIPGLILAFMWYIAVPICVVEGLGPIGSLTRSASLTKGHRWAVFGLWALTIVANLVILMVVGLIVTVASLVLGISTPGAIRIVSMSIQLLGQAISSGFSAVLLGAAYFALRQAREGIDTDRIAPVFD
jgi:hypothetical protein